MKYEVVKADGTTYEINPETIFEDERLDEALDSMSFCFTSNEVYNLPPFTILNVYNDSDTLEKQWYCSCESDAIIEMSGYYYNRMTCIEPLKRLETFIIGSKAFSVIDGVPSYNYGYNRLNIVRYLVLNEYGFGLNYDSSVTTKFTDQREYQFGAGTTAFDIISSVMKTQGCYPKVTSVGTNSLTIGYTDIDGLETTTVKGLSSVIKVTRTQSVDEYCSKITTEMASVVDRDTTTTVITTARSNEDYIKKDNACVLLPSNCESVNHVWMNLNGRTGATIFVPLSKFISPYTTETLDSMSEVRPYQSVSDADVYDYFDSDTCATLIAWRDYIRNGSTCSNFYMHFLAGVGGYLTIQLTDNDAITQNYVCLTPISSDQWNLLTTKQQPAFIYFNSDSNVIDGFNNYKDNDFWNAIIYGDRGPFIRELYNPSRKATEEIYRNPIYEDFEDGTLTYNGLKYRNSFHILWYKTSDNYSYSNNILDYIFKIEYIAKPSLRVDMEKTISAENETSWKKSSRSYNNGANTVDYNQLIPAMKRNADMIGLETKTVESLTDMPIGTRLTYGYIISKQSTYDAFTDGKSIQKIIYNCCKNFQQIASVIGVQTQYEATNVPTTGIITRYVNVDSLNNSNFATIRDSDSVFYIGITFGSTTLYKAATKVCTDDVMYMICEADDNFSLASQKVDSETSGYYVNSPVAYSDDNQYYAYYTIKLILPSSDLTKDELDALPTGSITGTTYVSKIVTVYKDPRERLVFQIRITQ